MELELKLDVAMDVDVDHTFMAIKHAAWAWDHPLAGPGLIRLKCSRGSQQLQLQSASKVLQ